MPRNSQVCALCMSATITGYILFGRDAYPPNDVSFDKYTKPYVLQHI